MLPDAERVVLGIDAEGVESDRLEHDPAATALEPSPRVGTGVRQGVTDVQTRGRGIRELDQVVQAVSPAGVVEIDVVQAVGGPPGAPPGLDLGVVIGQGHRGSSPPKTATPPARWPRAFGRARRGRSP